MVGVMDGWNFRTGFVFGRMYADGPADREVWRRLWEDGEPDGGLLLDESFDGLWVRYETADEWMGYPIGVVGSQEKGPQLEYVVCSIGKVMQVFRLEIELATSKWNLLRKNIKERHNVDIGEAELLFVNDYH